MKIETDHDAFDLFKNELDYISQSDKLKSPAAAMTWAVAEIDRLRDLLEVSEAVNQAKTELLIDVSALLADDDCTPGQRIMNARTAIAVRTGPPKSRK